MVVVDGTAGAAGHGRAIALAIGSSGHYVGLDRDREILARARSVLGGLSGGRARYSFHSALYSNMSKVLAEEGLSACDRVLLDIGVSSMQIDTPERGFSLRLDGPLDMRMNRDSGVTLGQWLARVTEEELSRVIYEYGEERHSRRIAKVIVNARTRGGCTARWNWRTSSEGRYRVAAVDKGSIPPPVPFKPFASRSTTNWVNSNAASRWRATAWSMVGVSWSSRFTRWRIASSSSSCASAWSCCSRNPSFLARPSVAVIHVREVRNCGAGSSESRMLREMDPRRSGVCAAGRPFGIHGVDPDAKPRRAGADRGPQRPDHLAAGGTSATNAESAGP